MVYNNPNKILDLKALIYNFNYKKNDRKKFFCIRGQASKIFNKK